MTVGGPGVGFVRIDGGGVVNTTNYKRFLSLNEMASCPSPERVVDEATVFRIHRDGQEETLNREEFERDQQRFVALVDS